MVGLQDSHTLQCSWDEKTHAKKRSGAAMLPMIPRPRGVPAVFQAGELLAELKQESSTAGVQREQINKKATRVGG